MALNSTAYTENFFRCFLKYQLTAYPFSDPRLHEQMKKLFPDQLDNSPLFRKE